MKFEEILSKLTGMVEEAAKVLHLDQSLSALRSKLQDAIAVSYRVSNPTADYYNYPYVEDVFGDITSGQVIYSKGGVFTMADYKASNGGYAITNEKTVKRAYSVVKEAEAQEATEVEDTGMVLEISEASAGSDGVIPIKIIEPGTGAMGHYTAEALKQAAKDKVFPKGMQMFVDHQTAEERAKKPEGSLRNLAAVLETDAEWKDKGKDGPGLYAKARIYKDFQPFIMERKKDIGISIRAAVKPHGTKKVDGVPVIERMVRGVSVDFVTRAGAGGKLLEMYESFRGSNPGSERPIAAKGESMEINEKELKTLQEAAALVPALKVQLDRLEEDNQRFRAKELVNEALASSKLPARGQDRVRTIVLATIPMKDGKLDGAAIQEAAKKAIADELAYLRESGATFSQTVTNNGEGKPTQEAEDKVLQESSKVLDESVALLTGVQKKGDK